MIILHPYELISPSQDQFLPKQITSLDLMECISEGSDGVIITVGNRLADAVDLKEILRERKKQNYAVYNLRWINPLPTEDLKILFKILLSKSCSKHVLIFESESNFTLSNIDDIG